jgi:hypothetical protein
MRGVGAALFCLWAGAAAATDYRAGPETYRDYLSRLLPGDRLLLAPGDYRQGLPLHGLAGTPQRPIVIEAAAPDLPPRFFARPRANTVSLVDVRHIVLRDLELDGGNVPVDAVKAEGHARFADFITLEHLHIHDHAASQQNVGISTKCPATGWVVRRNRIERVGTGKYFGDADGSDPFVAGLIEGNEIRATQGYNLQIKHQIGRMQDDAPPRDTVIRDNVFSKEGAEASPQPRPNVLLGHLPLAGAGSEDRYLVYGNRFLHNASEALLQAEGRVAVYDNVFINAAGDAIHIQPHNDAPRDITVFSNTVLASGTGIRVRNVSAPNTFRQRVYGNVVSASRGIDGGEAAHNLTLGYRPDLLDTAPRTLTTRLLESVDAPPQLPARLVRVLSGYPDWNARALPGARQP